MLGAPSRRAGRAVALAAAVLVPLALAASASAHAIVSPAVVKAKVLQQFTLSVPTEKEGATTTKITLTVPDGFGIDSWEAEPGWTRSVKATGSGEEAVVQTATWTGGKVPTGEDAVFRFNGEADSSQTYTFHVTQTYSDGTVVEWNGSESSDDPAPTVEAVSSLGGGSSDTLAIVALVVGAVGVLLGIGGIAFGLLGGGTGSGRPLA
jgi:uncharacterized protein YcnI